MADHFSEIIEEIVKGAVKDKRQLQALKKSMASKYGLKKFPTDADILEHAGKHWPNVVGVLQKKPSRTLSGVAIVAVMTKPSRCPHGRCIYCTGGIEIHTPQSYTGKEPATMRGIQYDFDPYEQTKRRIEQLESIGHPADKIELIVMGGTLTSQPHNYQETFIKRCFDAMNGTDSKNIKEAHIKNETSPHRCVGLTVETRPDVCKEKEINDILEFGATRVELGVQNPDDRIYKLVNRGHTVADVVESTRLLKDSFLKVNYHLMPNLPGSDLKHDLEMFEEIFKNPAYRPDMLKIYPCLLVKPEYGRTELHDLYEKGGWKPYTEEETARLIARAKKSFPKWVRVMRIQRDIPSQHILAGVKHSNLRQLVEDELEKQGTKCMCIRCREIRNRKIKQEKLVREDYEASGGKEIFLSYEDPSQDVLLGLLRLRVLGEPFRNEITPQTVGVRELHVYGPMVPIGKRPRDKTQHKGYGERLLEEAERIAREELDARNILVTSGVGVREYYRRLGYELKGAYMSKPLS